MQTTKVTQMNQDLICSTHNKQILMIIMDKQVPFSDIMLCEQCFSEKQTITSTIFSIAKVTAMIEEKYLELGKQQNKIKEESLQDLGEFKFQISELRTQVLQYFDEIQGITEFWCEGLQNLRHRLPSPNLIKEIEMLHQSNDNINVYEDQIGKLNRSNLMKLALKFKKLFLFDQYKSCYDQLNKLKIDNIGNTQQGNRFEGIKLSNIRREQIKSIEQVDHLAVMAFNIDGSMLVAGCNNEIKVWKFDKVTLTPECILKGHKDKINCLAFSKNISWFASGSDDSTIRCWKEKYNEQKRYYDSPEPEKWESNEPQKEHKDSVYSIIMNKKEDQFISSSADNTIKVWGVSCKSNQLQFDYTLERTRHTSAVFSISLNESETSLVSCSQDKQIILWVKGKSQKWVYQNNVMKDDYGYRICFINEYQIAWQQCHQGFTHILEIENGQIKDKPDQKISLNQVNKDEPLFPTIVNKQREIIIQNHNKYVYIIRRQQDGKYQVDSESIDCDTRCHSGALTEDGSYLILRNSRAKELRVYKLTYD